MSDSKCTHWIKHKHNTGFVYRPYYHVYLFDNKPYFEPLYISTHDKKYDPVLHCNNSFKLKDGTVIENFNEHNHSNNWTIITFIIIILLLFLFVI